MTPSELPPRLQQFRSELEDAIEHELEQVSAAERMLPRRRPARRPLLVGSGAAVVAAVAAAAVLILSASSATAPAYGISTNPDGTYAIEVSQLTSDIPTVNTRLASLGIDETIIPVTSDCSHQGLFGGTISGDYLYRLTPGRRYLDPGYDGYLAATPLGDGRYALAQGAMRPPLPSCFSTGSPIFQPQATSTAAAPTTNTHSAPATTATTP